MPSDSPSSVASGDGSGVPVHEAIAVYQVVGIVRRSDELDIIDDLPQIVHLRLE